MRKYSKRYVALTVILAIIFIVNFNIYAHDNSRLGNFRGAVIEDADWNPLVAKDVNGSTLNVIIDNKVYSSKDYNFYMSVDRRIMVPVELLTEALNCSAHIYNESALLVEKHNISEVIEVNPSETGKYYVSLSELSEILGYACNFEITTKTITAVDESENASYLPASYDLRLRDRMSAVKNQGSYGTCWAFAATSALESALLPEESVLFSVDHMSMSNSFDADQYEGGEYTMGMAYLAAWQGPVYEADDPYGDNKTDGSLAAVKHVQEMRIIDGKDYESIKEAVFKYGGVTTSLYSNLRASQTSSEYYSKENNAYCYIGTEKPNHDVLIIGWDDNFPKERFSVDLEGDGAFICQNSWGTDFGEDGVFYVSYYDTNVGTHNVVYTRIDNVDNYDNIYQSDLCGWRGKLGFDKEEIYAANVFEAKGDEEVTATGFYATTAGTEYEVYVVNAFQDESSLTTRTLVASGSLEQAGYYTVDFDEPVSVVEGEKFAVMLYLKTPGYEYPMAIEYDSGESYLSSLDLEDGEGYISYTGNKFINVKEKRDCNLCIKAFTNGRESS